MHRDYRTYRDSGVVIKERNPLSTSSETDSGSSSSEEEDSDDEERNPLSPDRPRAVDSRVVVDQVLTPDDVLARPRTNRPQPRGAVIASPNSTPRQQNQVSDKKEDERQQIPAIFFGREAESRTKWQNTEYGQQHGVYASIRKVQDEVLETWRDAEGPTKLELFEKHKPHESFKWLSSHDRAALVERECRIITREVTISKLIITVAVIIFPFGIDQSNSTATVSRVALPNIAEWLAQKLPRLRLAIASYLYLADEMWHGSNDLFKRFILQPLLFLLRQPGHDHPLKIKENQHDHPLLINHRYDDHDDWRIGPIVREIIRFKGVPLAFTRDLVPAQPWLLSPDGLQRGESAPSWMLRSLEIVWLIGKEKPFLLDLALALLERSNDTVDLYGTVRSVELQFGKSVQRELDYKRRQLRSRTLTDRKGFEAIKRRLPGLAPHDWIQERPLVSAETRTEDEASRKPDQNRDPVILPLIPVDLVFQHANETLLQSQDYAEFRCNLLEFVHRPYERRITAALGREILSSSEGQVHPASAESTARELSWVPPELIQFLPNSSLSTLDHLKGYVEDLMGETWNWWPLRQRVHPVRKGYVRVKWITPCGSDQSIDIPALAANAVQDTLQYAPAFLEPDGCYRHVENVSTSGSAGPASGLSQASDPVHSPTRGQQSPATKQTLPSNVGNLHSRSSNPQNSAFNPPSPRPVYLCIRTAGSYNVSTIRSDLMKNDIEFFSHLKLRYLQVRGKLRLWFSMWQYDHCSFFRFHKYGIELCEPTKIEFPSDTDPDYDFLPRPLFDRPPEGPIPEGQFRAHFYQSCHLCYTWHLHRRRDIFSPLNKTALESLPKRKVELELADGKDEVFWGLFARERRCFAWVFAYACLCNVPGVVFFFLWLFQWKHANDLQDASVPCTLSLSLTVCFVALLYESREGNLR